MAKIKLSTYSNPLGLQGDFFLISKLNGVARIECDNDKKEVVEKKWEFNFNSLRATLDFIRSTKNSFF